MVIRSRRLSRSFFVALVVLIAPVHAAAERIEAVIQAGHSDAIRAIAFSPDGTLLASAGVDETVRLTAVDTRREIAALRGDPGPVHSIAFSPDGAILASASTRTQFRGFGRITLWNVSTRTVLRHIPANVRDSGHVAFSPDGTLLASGTNGDTDLTLWDVATGKKLRTLLVSGGVRSLAFSPYGKLLAAGTGSMVSGRDAAAVLLDVQTGRLLDMAMKAMTEVVAVAFSPDGKHLAFDAGSAVGLWEIATRNVQFRNVRHHVTALAFSGDGETLAVAIAPRPSTIRVPTPPSWFSPPVPLVREWPTSSLSASTATPIRITI